jgi:S-DNA-T family DNA segregation ATPase FtsK/SpoIIIE
MNAIQDFETILKAFRIKASCVNYKMVDNYFFYDLKLLPNTKVNDIKRYSDEISLALKTPCKPSIKILHQEGLVRLEFAGPRINALNLFDLFTNTTFPKGNINCLLGQGISGEKVWMDLAQNPHMLIAGSTGSGKSTLLHNIIANLLNYSNVDLFLIDPKRIEFGEYQTQCGAYVAYTYNEATNYLYILHEYMEYRYELMRQDIPVIDMKPVVVIIDEFADLIMQDKDDLFVNIVCRLAQKCRAARIYLILATQRPSVNIVSGSIKANFSARIACRLPSHVDSKVILDSIGAESLLGKGDALLRDNFRNLERFQIAYTTPQEVCKRFNKNNVSRTTK